MFDTVSKLCYYNRANRRKEARKRMVSKTLEKKRRGRPSINDETKDLVIRLYNEDKMTCEQIAKAVNIGRASVFRIIRERRAD